MQNSSFQRLALDIRSKAGPTTKICFVSGNFNILHPGHVRLLRFAAEVGDYLVVGVNPDASQGISVPREARMDSLRALEMVDEVVPLDGPCADYIAELRPEFVVKGREFEDRENLEQAAVDSYGGKLVFGSGETQLSSYSLIDRQFSELALSTISMPVDFPQRHDFRVRDLVGDLARMAGIRVLVIGDLIVDDYITCDALGMSQEDPTIVVTPIETKTFVGGAGVVSAHVNNLGAKVDFVTVVGDDETAKFARDTLEKQGIGTHFFTDETRPTTRKQRYRAGGKTLLRVNHLRQHPISMQLIRNMIRQVGPLLDRCDLLLFSDFNYGCLPQALVDAVTNRALSRRIVMAADSQASSQMADISRFKRMRLITPTEREARMALRDSQSGLPIVAANLVRASEAEAVVITLGGEGMLVYGKKDGEYITERLPAFNHAPKDTAGAGDSFFATASLAICAGVDIWRSTYLGAIAAGCQVGRVGNASLLLKDIRNELELPDLV